MVRSPQFLWPCLTAAWLLSHIAGAADWTAKPWPTREFQVPYSEQSFTLSENASSLRELDQTLEELERIVRERRHARKRERQDQLKQRPLLSLNAPELYDWYAPAPGWLGKKQSRALAALKRITENALNASTANEREEQFQQLFEIADALRNLQNPPVPDRVDFLQAPLYLWRYLYVPVGRGTTRAANLTAPAPGADLSQVDPPDSTFWTKPVRVSERDLAAGFGRRERPDHQNRVWEYAGPKTGSGTAPGFEVKSPGTRLKVKFAETHSEPFASRIFGALGYNVEPTDHVPSLKIRYDRRLLREFNVRRDVSTRVTTFLVPSYVIRIQKRHDPFSCLAGAILKDGTRISVDDLKEKILNDRSGSQPEDEPDNFNAAGEAQIESLLTNPASVQSDTWRRHSVGIWDFDELGHADLRELRGLTILAAWIGWFDCRPLNTRLEVIPTGAGFRLRHAFTDLGSCLGGASSLTSRHCERPDEFEPTFTSPPRPQGPGRMTIPFRVTNYRPIELPEAFKRMALDDARWMARLIGQLRESQIKDALVAAGFSSAETAVYLQKLLSRRERLLQDLGL